MKAMALVAAVSMVAGCARGVPSPDARQIEQAPGTGHEGRQRSYQTCTRTETTLAALLDCMAGFRYGFVARGDTGPAAACWRLRDARGATLPPAHCFVPSRVPRAPASEGAP